MRLPGRTTCRIALVLAFALGAIATCYLAKSLPPPQVALVFVDFEAGKAKVIPVESPKTEAAQLDPNTDPATGLPLYQLSNPTNAAPSAAEINVGDGLITDEAHEDRASGSSKNAPLLQTNAVAVLHFTNRGQVRVWWKAEFSVEAKTPAGWITNNYGAWTIKSDWSIAPFSEDDFRVDVPADATEWRVVAWYSYYKRHNARWEYMGWLVDDIGFSTKRGQTPPKYLYPVGLVSAYAVAPVLAMLPEPEEEIATVHSGLFTNRPPAYGPAASQSSP